MTEKEHVKLGAYRTLEIEQQQTFTIYLVSCHLGGCEQAGLPPIPANLVSI